MTSLVWPPPLGVDPVDYCVDCKEMWQKGVGCIDLPAWEAHCKQVHLPKPKKVFAFTLTTNGDDPAVEEDRLIVASNKLFHQESVPVARGEAYLEYTEAGRPHIHGWYQTEDGGRIFSKVFKRCWPLWGETAGRKQFAGGYHEEMKTNRYLGYANAEQRLVAVKK